LIGKMRGVCRAYHKQRCLSGMQNKGIVPHVMNQKFMGKGKRAGGHWLVGSVGDWAHYLAYAQAVARARAEGKRQNSIRFFVAGGRRGRGELIRPNVRGPATQSSREIKK